MTDRERWIVYPLLLFSLGIGMRGKVFPGRDIKVDEVHTDRIVGLNHKTGKVVCGDLEVYGQLTVVGLDTNKENGQGKDKDKGKEKKIQTRVRIGEMIWPAADAQSSPQASGGIEIYGADGQPIIQMLGRHDGHVQVHALIPQRGQELTPLGLNSIPGMIPPENSGVKIPPPPPSTNPPPKNPDPPGDLP